MNKIIIRQDDEADCGACSLYSIISYFKGFVPLELIKYDTLTSKSGTTFLNLKNAGIKYGFDVYGFNGEINNKCLPCIIQTKINGYNHFIVVYEIHRDYYLCMDPAKGMVKIKLDDFNKMFTGNILKFTPINNIVKYKKNNYFINYLYSLFKENIRTIILIIVLSVLFVFSSYVGTYILKSLISNYSLLLLSFYVLLSSLKVFLDYFKNYYLAYLNFNINTKIIYGYLKHYFKLPFKYIQLKNPGDIISRINDINSFKDFFGKELVNMLLYFIFFIGTLIIIACYNYYLGLIIMFITIVLLMIGIILSKKYNKYYYEVIDSENSFMNLNIEYINKIKVIKNMRKEDLFLKKVNDSSVSNYSNYFNLECKINNYNFILGIYNVLLFVISFVFLLYSKSLISNIFMIYIFLNYYYESVSYYYSLLPSFIYFKNVLSRINAIYYLKDKCFLKPLKLTNYDICINNLSYSINNKSIYNNFNLKIRMGEKILLLGENGSGKSTLFNLLVKNIDNYKGNILIGKNDLRRIRYDDLNNFISYVSQENTIFNDTFLNNIILDNEYDEYKFKLILNLVDLDGFIKKRCDNYEFVIRDNISGGESQKIILARTLYQDFNILLLDEAMSEISKYSRMKIINNINNYFKNKTIIYISHYYEKYPFDKVVNLTDRKE